MFPVVGEEICGLMTGANHSWIHMQQDGRFQFSRMHVAVRGRAQAGLVPRAVPVGRSRKERHASTRPCRLLNCVTQRIVSTVSVDQNQIIDAGSAERFSDVPDNGTQGGRGNADRSRPSGVFVRTGDRHRRQTEHHMGGCDLPGDGAGHYRIGHQGKIRTMLLEAADGKNCDTGPTGPRIRRRRVR